MIKTKFLIIGFLGIFISAHCCKAMHLRSMPSARLFNQSKLVLPHQSSITSPGRRLFASEGWKRHKYDGAFPSVIISKTPTQHELHSLKKLEILIRNCLIISKDEAERKKLAEVQRKIVTATLIHLKDSGWIS